MNIIATLRVVVVAFASICIATAAMAERIPIQKKDQVEGRCGESGGVYFSPNKQGVYGCLNEDGSGIVCGGVQKVHKKTCDTFREAPRRLPTRAEAGKAGTVQGKPDGTPGK